jgi:hypothetical protein
MIINRRGLVVIGLVGAVLGGSYWASQPKADEPEMVTILFKMGDNRFYITGKVVPTQELTPAERVESYWGPLPKNEGLLAIEQALRK